MDKMREWMQKDWVLKTMAVCIAVLLWFYAEAEQNPVISKTFDIPIQIVNLPDNYVADNNIKTVRLVVRGKSADLGVMRGDDFTAIVDLQNAKLGNDNYQVNVNVPVAVEKYSVTPNALNLTIDELIDKQLPVQPVVSGTTEKGYLLEGVEVKPELVSVHGKSEVVNALEKLETEAIDISTMTETTEVKADLILPAGVQVLSGSTVALTIKIQEELFTAEYTGIIQPENVPPGMTVSLNTTEVKAVLSGKANALNDAEEINQLKFYVDCTGIEAGESDKQVLVHSDGTLEIAELTPNMVTVIAKTTTTQPNPMNSDSSENKHDDAEGEEE